MQALVVIGVIPERLAVDAFVDQKFELIAYTYIRIQRDFKNAKGLVLVRGIETVGEADAS